MTDQQSVRHLPAPPDGTRPVQFGDDKPGLFVRRDNVFDLMARIRRLTDLLADHQDPAVATALTSLAQLAVAIERGIPPTRHVFGRLPKPPSKEEAEVRSRAIAAEQGTLGKSTLENLVGKGKNLWDSDEDLDRFLADLRARKRNCDCDKE